MLFFGRFRGQADIIFISPAREWDFWFRLNLNMNRALLLEWVVHIHLYDTSYWYMLIWTSVKDEFWICQFQLVLCCSVLYSTTHGMIETHGMNWKTFFCEQEWSHNWAQQCDYANPLPAESVMYLQSTCTCRMNLCIISYFKPSNIVSIHSAHSMCYVYVHTVQCTQLFFGRRKMKCKNCWDSLDSPKMNATLVHHPALYTVELVV